MNFGKGLMDEYRLPVIINVFSALSIRCRRGCGIRCILRMTIPVCLSLQGNYVTLTNMSETMISNRIVPLSICRTDQYFVPDDEPGAAL